MKIKNEFLCLAVDPENGNFSIISKIHDTALRNIQVGINFSSLGRSVSSLNDNWGLFSWTDQSSATHNSGEQIELTLGPDEFGIHYVLTFKISSNSRAVQWRLKLSNQSRKPIWLEKITLLDLSLKAAGNQNHKSFLGISDSHFKDQFFFSNGWQSWSGTGIKKGLIHQHRTKLKPFLAARSENHGTIEHNKAGHYWSDFYALYGDTRHETGAVLGFLTQQENFGSISIDMHPKTSASLKMWANGDSARIDPGMTFVTDWAYFQFVSLNNEHPYDDYLKAVNQENQCRKFSGSPTGWCSWYQYFQDISDTVIKENTKMLAEFNKKLPLNLVQTDDGFVTKIGDWYDLKRGFEHGLTDISSYVAKKNFTPGIWLAPYILQADSQIQKEHPDFILKGYDDRPVNAGFGWNGLTTALDLTHPGVHEHVCKLIDNAVHHWGFNYLKLDFLYAGALRGKHLDPTKTRAQSFHTSLKAIREMAGKETYLLACGCPIGAGIGLFDGMRISTDISESWTPEFMGVRNILKNEETMPSAKYAIRNMLTRAHQHKKWWNNDPDCVQLRDKHKLTLAERQSHITVVALTGGSYIISDNLKKLSEENVNEGARLLPLIDKRPVIVDLWQNEFPKLIKLPLSGAPGDWYLLAYFNWSDKKEKAVIKCDQFKLNSDRYFVRSYWDDQVRISSKGEPLWTGAINPHGVVLLAVRSFSSTPVYLGGSLHISQGLEVEALEMRGDSCSIQLNLQHEAEGFIDMYLPVEPAYATAGDDPVKFAQIENRLYRIFLSLDKSFIVNIFYK